MSSVSGRYPLCVWVVLTLIHNLCENPNRDKVGSTLEDLYSFNELARPLQCNFSIGLPNTCFIRQRFLVERAEEMVLQSPNITAFPGPSRFDEFDVNYVLRPCDNAFRASILTESSPLVSGRTSSDNVEVWIISVKRC